MTDTFFRLSYRSRRALRVQGGMQWCATLLAACCVSCASIDVTDKPGFDQDFYFVTQTNARQVAPDTYFKHEYEYLNSRNGTGPTAKRPAKLAGLAFSGGGIRSSAFQLGILSGLHRSRYNNAPLMQAIDYISSVSGGSWANGAYWSAAQDDQQFFACLDAYADTGSAGPDCGRIPTQLRGEQKISLLPVGAEGLIQRKESWESDIRAAYLSGCDIDFSRKADFKDCLDRGSKRPYPIFNSTHSAVRESASAEHFHFESTPDFVGTVEDKPPYRGFFLKTGSASYVWEHRKWQRWIPWGDKDRSGEALSLYLAHSSGVIGSDKPFLLEYNFHAHYLEKDKRGNAIDGLRRFYNLADGGKSDNSGSLSLFERGVDTIVMSHIGKEGDEFDDLILAATKARQLFQCEFPHGFARDIPVVVKTAYDCRVSGRLNRNGKLIIVRPTVTNIDEFRKMLKEKNPALSKAIEDQDKTAKPSDRFPETPTFQDTYSPELIRGYFLLGRHIAQGLLKPALTEELDKKQ